MSDFDLPKGITMHKGKLRIAFRPPNEKQQWKRSLGIPPTKANIKAAEQMLNSIRRDISLGQFNLADYFPNDPSLKKDEKMLSNILQKHFIEASVGRVKDSTVRVYKHLVRPLLEAVGDWDISKLSPKEAKQFRVRVIDTAPSVYLANRRLWAIKIAIRRAVIELDLEADPFGPLLDNVERKSKAVTRGEEDEAALSESSVFTIEEAERIVEATKSEQRKRLITFMFWSGLRPGEALALRREDVCLPYITVKRTLTKYGTIQTPKSGLARKIYLPSSARSVLEQQLLTHDSERVWLTERGLPFKKSDIMSMKAWRKTLEAAGVGYKKRYITRHSFASWMLKAGEPEASVAAHLGHSNVSMIRKTYGKFIPDAKPEWTLDDPSKVEKLKKSM